MLDPDARTCHSRFGTGSSPVWTVNVVGSSSPYAMANRDAAGEYLDGGKSCRLDLPANIPVKNFWPVLVHDPQNPRSVSFDFHERQRYYPERRPRPSDPINVIAPRIDPAQQATLVIMVRIDTESTSSALPCAYEL